MDGQTHPCGGVLGLDFNPREDREVRNWPLTLALHWLIALGVLGLAGWLLWVLVVGPFWAVLEG